MDGQDAFGQFRADMHEGDGYLLTGARLEGFDPHDCGLAVGEDPDVTFPSNSFAVLQCVFRCLPDTL